LKKLGDVDWQLSNMLDTDFCPETLERALFKEKPEIFNTDQFNLRVTDGSGNNSCGLNRIKIFCFSFPHSSDFFLRLAFDKRYYTATLNIGHGFAIRNRNIKEIQYGS
jgi:hypothetical protein